MLRWIRLAPVTTEALVVCVAIFVSCEFQATAEHQRFEDVQREWGAIQQRQHLDRHDGVRSQKESELQGPFDVWEGAWWRIPLTAFHHNDLIHLLISVGATFYLGRLLEQKWGSFHMGLFLVPAVCIPIMAELCFGNSVMGFSGAICAVLGALTVLRQFDEKMARTFPAEAVVFGATVIVLGCLATATGTMPFANVAHLAGFVYGAIIAAVSGSPDRKVRLLRISVVLFHLWLIPAVFLVTHPFWIGRYHWYRSVSVRNPAIAKKSLERAAACDPALAGVWLRLSEIAEEKQDFMEAWRQIVRGLATNPSNARLIDSTRRIWRHLDSRQRPDAERTLKEFFGRQATVWLKSIRASIGGPDSYSTEEKTISSEDIDLLGIALDRKVELPSLNLTPGPQQFPKPMDAEEMNNAAEGQPL